MILLPLRPASLTHKNPQRREIIHCPVERRDRSIDRSEDVFVEYPVHVITVAVIVTVV